jgi:hypothetical protein
MEEENDNVRAPDSVVFSTLYDSEEQDSPQIRINQLISFGLSPQEARTIVEDQIETAKNDSRIMNLENKAFILKEQMKAKERERQHANKLASEASSSSEEAAFKSLVTKIAYLLIRFNKSTKEKIEQALMYKKNNGIKSQMEISDQELTSIEEEINKIIKNPRANMTENDGEAIIALFTTPVHGDSDYEGYNSGYDTSGGRRTRKARKSRKSRKSKKSKKSRKTRKNKRK